MANLFDSSNYPETEPSQFTAGDRVTWKRTDLEQITHQPHILLNIQRDWKTSGATEIEITASESGSDYIVEVGQSTSVTFKSGIYHWQAYITRTSDSERITIDSGTWEIQPNRDTTASDPRNHVKRVLDAIEAVIEGGQRVIKKTTQFKVVHYRVHPYLIF